MPPPKSPPWYHMFTIDTLLRLFTSVLLHPIISLFLPLSLLALSHPPSSQPVINAMLYATFVNLHYFATLFNTRLSAGPARAVDLGNELIIISGGASGLGLLLAEVYGLRGVAVAVLDVAPPSEGAAQGVYFHTCDVSDPAAVAAARTHIEEEFGQRATVVVHAAAVVAAGPVLAASAEDVARGLGVNLGGAFNLVREFVPGMVEERRGTVVLISSALGGLPARNAGIYAASKAGLTALYHSLRAELGGGRGEVKTVLVTAGQMGTGLFRGVKTPSWFWAPVLEPVEVAKEIIRVVDAGVGGEVALPLYVRWLPVYYVLPGSVQRALRWWSGVDSAMEGFGKSEVEGKEGVKVE
ncbi:hypothetical protein EDC01DRAFT_37947 [Geopyxis carbonaria]|nr:hypothetical protein EDC01DRAFT_37947 [Geopyxis carbonaria]